MATKNNFLRGKGCNIVDKTDVDLEPVLDALTCTTAGNAVLTDLMNVISTVPMLAGQTLALGIKRLAASSTGAYIGIYSGNGFVSIPVVGTQVTNSSLTNITNSDLTLVTT